MVDYGGMGGIWDGRKLNEEDQFEMAIYKELGERMKTDDGLCRRVWGSLANVDWTNANGDTAGYSFRAAGDLVAAVRGSGMYMDWYCSTNYPSIDNEVRDALAKHGWSGEPNP